MPRPEGFSPPNPSGLCLCGCGRPTPRATVNRYNLGHMKGEHTRFYPGHTGFIGKKRPPEFGRKISETNRKHTVPLRDGRCECGCGKMTRLAKKTSASQGIFEGFPLRFVTGHHNRMLAVRAKWSAQRKGRIPTEETRQKLSAVRKGVVKSKQWLKNIGLAQKGKPKPALRGEKHYNWKGGAGTVRVQESADARLWSATVKQRDKYTCQDCGLIQRYGLHAHHLLPFAEYPEHRYDVANGITLCLTCHWNRHRQLPPENEPTHPTTPA